MHNWLLEMCETCLNGSIEGITKLFYTIWIIWKAENEAVFDDGPPRPIDVLFRVNIMSSEFLNSVPKQIGSNNPPNETIHVTRSF